MTHDARKRRQQLSQLCALIIASLLLGGCQIGRLRITFPGRATETPPIVLEWCDEARDVLCVLSFGLEPPDEMVILLLASPGLPPDLEARAAWDGESAPYPCVATSVDETLFACTGPLIPLGTSVHIDVYTADGQTRLASGDFVLKALALPTVGAGVDAPPTAPFILTPRPTRTPGGTPYPNPTPQP